MRTSPLGMRRILRRAPSALIVTLALLAATGAACSGDGDDDGTSPTTTSPATTTTETDADGGDDTTAEEPTEPGDPTEPGSSTTAPPAGEEITPAYVEGVLTDLMDGYREAVASAKASGAFDEAYFVLLSEVFSSSEGQRQTNGLQNAGGVAVVKPQPGAPEVGAVEIISASTECIAVQVEPFRLDPLVDIAVPGPAVGSFRLVPAEDEGDGPAWRINVFERNEDGSFVERARCPE